jgi:hypothetical protein
MAVKTLNNSQSVVAQSVVSPISAPRVRTYSVEPRIESDPGEVSCISETELQSFLDAENPLGCFRGVMWVMAFNAVVFLLGVAIWQSCKLLL